MDGAPVKGESIPVRLFLGHFDLTPTYRNVHNKFSVKYFLNLVLVDEEDRRYFKQQEVTLWRRSPLRPVSMAPTKLDLAPSTIAFAPATPDKPEEKKEENPKEKPTESK